MQDKLQLVSVLGAGLLVGTALAVIIPEGVRALFSGAASVSATAHESKEAHGKITLLILLENSLFYFTFHFR